jgi:hypothetical protein
MEDSGPFTAFVWALRLLIVPVAIALGWLALMRKKFGGYDLKDWVVAGGGGVAALMVLLVASHLQARYLEAVGSNGQGTLVRKWLEEGDDSTTYKIAVNYARHEDDFEVDETFWDTAQPNGAVPVYYDPEYPADFVPHACTTTAPQTPLVIGLLGSGGLVIALTFAWTFARTVERFKS